LGKVFIDLAERLKDYAIYINGFDTAIEKMNGITSKAWKQFLLDVREQNRKEFNLLLEGFLLMPVQRVPRYNLLLTDLYTHTPEAHIDRIELGIALESIRKVADYINEAKRQAEQQQAMRTISVQLYNFPESEGSLVKLGRMYVKQGNVLHHRKKGSSKYVYLFLLSDILIITVQKKKERFEFLDLLHVKKMQFDPLQASKELRNAFKMVEGDSEYTLFTSSPVERFNWVNAIEDARQK